MVWVKMWVNCLTHTLTHKRKEPKSTGEEIVSFPVLCLPAGLIESVP